MSGVSFVSGTRPLKSPLLRAQLEEVVETWAKSQFELVTLAAVSYTHLTLPTICSV